MLIIKLLYYSYNYCIFLTYSSNSFGEPTRLHNLANIALREAETPEDVMPTKFAINEVENSNFTNKQI